MNHNFQFPSHVLLLLFLFSFLFLDSASFFFFFLLLSNLFLELLLLFLNLKTLLHFPVAIVDFGVLILHSSIPHPRRRLLPRRSWRIAIVFSPRDLINLCLPGRLRLLLRVFHPGRLVGSSFILAGPGRLSRSVWIVFHPRWLITLTTVRLSSSSIFGPRRLTWSIAFGPRRLIIHFVLNCCCNFWRTLGFGYGWGRWLSIY